VLRAKGRLEFSGGLTFHIFPTISILSHMGTFDARPVAFL
jgi:hypothetical protein